jgi:hypothetical protein
MREVLNISRKTNEVLLAGDTDKTIEISKYLSGLEVETNEAKNISDFVYIIYYPTKS